MLRNTHPVTVQYNNPEYLNTGSPQTVTVCFATIQNEHGFETRRPKIKKKKNYKNLKTA
jgi:YbbR domain-containing protein